jgi:hypothetical protein
MLRNSSDAGEDRLDHRSEMSLIVDSCVVVLFGSSSAESQRNGNGGRSPPLTAAFRFNQGLHRHV